MAEKIELEDDDKDRVVLLIEKRLPWLAIGLIGGMIATFFSSQFEEVLAKNISLAFFIPVIVYMADAVGTQTQSVYVRNLARGKVIFKEYLFKETILGMATGLLFGVTIFLFALLLFKSSSVALSVGLAMFVTMATAPLIALFVPTILQKEHQDPAVGAGPFTTIVQDLISLMLYFLIATIIIVEI